ncbi:protein NODULATION SIGNALING PATHWAY 2-like [Rutidosis leptorrhynchoides]|uniref:protein NODULATION SIGNALING PATHWAY 2-like n=1 Tax=Rutidosis leptorrhynchoides TaxID=125765 RepID=UPI003A99F7D1
MMQSELLIQTSWPLHSYFNSNLDHYESDQHEFLSQLNSNPENSTITHDCSLLDYDIRNQTVDGDDSQYIMALDDVRRWLCDVDQEIEEIQSNDTFESVLTEELNDVMDPESQSGLKILLNAYAEAMSMGQMELSRVIVRCISEKVIPIGPTIERIAFNLFRCTENQEEAYLKQESMRNFKTAFRTFYEVFPYGRFAHFTANLAIIEALPTHVESVHIIDFDLCEGSQWPVVIEAISQQGKSLTITSVKLDDHDSQFEHTKWQLCSYARNFGLNLKVQEMDMRKIREDMERSTFFGREFVVFNGMVSLPHMGRTRKTTQVMTFLDIAKAVLAKNEGIITFGDGEDCKEKIRNSSDFSSFFNKYMSHYRALYESTECSFLSYLKEARMAMETLFFAPFISSQSWFQKWDEGRENAVARMELGLKGRPMSEESLNEAKELVKEGESLYGVRIEGENGNEMVLEWNGTPLVKVSVWV